MAKNKMIESAVAARHDFDGDGYSYIDNGSGSDWRNRAVAADAEMLYPEEILDEAVTLMKEFCNRVDAGEIRSRKTYAKFKIFIANVEAGNHIDVTVHYGGRGGGKATDFTP